jgi:hypothetical protein
MEAKNQGAYGVGYKAMTDLISDAEKETQSKAPAVLDIKPIIEAPASKRTFTYIDMLGELDSIIANKQKGTVKEAVQAYPQPQAQHIIASGVAQSQLSNTMPNISGAQEGSGELGPEEMLKQIPLPKFKYMSAKKVDVERMVLPSLSMSDQIAELERIMEGIRENIFDAEHFEIVMEEVYSLVKSVDDRKKRMKKSGANVSALEQSLWLLRDRRLEEAIGAINSLNG